MPSIGPLECIIGLALILICALFVFVFLKIISAIRGQRELGDRPSATTAERQNEPPPTASDGQ